MYRKFLALLLIAILVMGTAGCNFSLESLGLGKVEEFFDDSPIICKITEKEGKVLKVVVLSHDGHYDKDDTLYVDYNALPENGSLKNGEIITFTYDYINKVTVKNDLPYILVDTIEITQYIPPVTEATEETEETAPSETTGSAETTQEATATEGTESAESDS